MKEPFYQDDYCQIFHGDCREILPQLPKVDLVLTDPPYGLQWSGTGFQKQPLLDHKEAAEWDKKPDVGLLLEIKAKGDKAVIWGGNYLADALGSFPSPFVWDKMTGSNPFADGELAWTSLEGTLRIFRHQWCGAFKDSETMAVMTSSEDMTWFDLDPCCKPETAKCQQFFTELDNGLAQSWKDRRVFMNPPYGRDIPLWMKKAYEEARDNGALVVCFVPARVDTDWWHRYATKGEIRFPKGRVKFAGAENSAPFPVGIVIFRPRL